MGGVTANAGEGLTGRRPGAGCAGSPHTPLYPRGVWPPLAHVQDGRHVFIPGQTWGHRLPPPPPERPGEGAGLTRRRVESHSQEPRLLVLSSPIFKTLLVELTYSAVLMAAVQQSGSVIHTHMYLLFIFFSSRVNGRTLNIVPCALQFRRRLSILHIPACTC